jgi:hypothetical protein
MNVGRGWAALSIAIALLPLVTAAADQRVAAPACEGSHGYANSFGGRRTFLLRPDWLAATKARGVKDPALAAAWKQVFALADAALDAPLYSVINKSRIPPSGDKHDYMSMGPYWWPDPKQAGGEAYIRRDGEVNPERASDAFDVTSMERMSAAVEALSLAYYFSDDQRYALKAAELLRTWFLRPATRMNPNASFAQGVPGRTPGRAEGVLDTSRLIRVVEGIGLLAPANVLSKAEQAALERWFADYSSWMMTSATGKEERAADNNHGLWYDYQLALFSLFARREDVARSVVSAAPLRFAKQIEPDGKMPRELQRTRAFHYSVYALRAAVGVAEVGQCLKIDLWREAPQGSALKSRGLKAALDFIEPYVGREQEFPYPDLKPGPSEVSFEVFSRAARAYDNADYRRAAATLAHYNPDSEVNLTIAWQ